LSEIPQSPPSSLHPLIEPSISLPEEETKSNAVEVKVDDPPSLDQKEEDKPKEESYRFRIPRTDLSNTETFLTLQKSPEVLAQMQQINLY
jgi:hypothetical protein